MLNRVRTYLATDLLPAVLTNSGFPIFPDIYFCHIWKVFLHMRRPYVASPHLRTLLDMTRGHKRSCKCWSMVPGFHCPWILAYIEILGMEYLQMLRQDCTNYCSQFTSPDNWPIIRDIKELMPGERQCDLIIVCWVNQNPPSAFPIFFLGLFAIKDLPNTITT